MQPSGVDLSFAYTAAQAAMLAVASNPSDFVSLGDGWTVLAPPLCGDFQSHYDVRAFVAVQAYLRLQASEAIYPL
jgi:hypothetical protein